MISWLAKKFIQNSGDHHDPRVRQAYGVLCSLVGISLNVLLFIGKLSAGTISGSIAITADAFNNISDAGASLITLIGFKFAGRRPDPSHPFGHGRIEYLSGLAVSAAIIFMGVELARTSVEKIIHPEPVQGGTLVFVILALSIGVKLYMYAYNNRIGKQLHSAGMRATAIDSLSDTIATGVVLLSTLLTMVAGINIDGWCGAVVGLFILYSGINAARETISPLLGQAPTPELIQQIYAIVMSHDYAKGVHDLVVHDYGPGRMMISLHVEVPGDVDVFVLHDMIDHIEAELNQAVECESIIHMDPIVTNDSQVAEKRQALAEILTQLDPEITIHDFRMVAGPTHTNLIFDAVIPYGLKLTPEQAEEKIKNLVHTAWPDHFAVVRIDRPYVDQQLLSHHKHASHKQAEQ